MHCPIILECFQGIAQSKYNNWTEQLIVYEVVLSFILLSSISYSFCSFFPCSTCMCAVSFHLHSVCVLCKASWDTSSANVYQMLCCHISFSYSWCGPLACFNVHTLPFKWASFPRHWLKYVSVWMTYVPFFVTYPCIRWFHHGSLVTTLTARGESEERMYIHVYTHT